MAPMPQPAVPAGVARPAYHGACMSSSPLADARSGQRIALAGIVASGCLAALNITVGLVSRSTSVFATGVEFAGDVLASSVVLLGMVAAAKPADDDHPYGHGRVETLAAFVVGIVLSAGGAGISWNSLQAVGAQHPPPTAIAIVALVVAIVVRGVMAALKFRVGRRLRSAALVADGWNDAVDILVGSRGADRRRRSRCTTTRASWPPTTTAASSSASW